MLFSMRGISTKCAIISTLLIVGCYGNKQTPPANSGVKVTVDMSAHEGDDHRPGPALSEEDQALAALQRLCPVSGEELGGMGPPVKLTIKGLPVFICCSGCEKKVNADPDAYLAKVAELKKADPE